MKESTIYTVIGLAAIATGICLLGSKNHNTTTPNKNMPNDNLPRGYRNNNPLNIRINAANNWLGKVLPNTDTVFEQFTRMEYGYRAAMQLIRNYIKAGYNTVSAIINRWAPNNENNTERYIQRVCSTTGLSPDTIIGAYDMEQLCALVYAMAIVENGKVQGHPNLETIIKAYNLL